MASRDPRSSLSSRDSRNLMYSRDQKHGRDDREQHQAMLPMRDDVLDSSHQNLQKSFYTRESRDPRQHQDSVGETREPWNARDEHRPSSGLSLIEQRSAAFRDPRLGRDSSLDGHSDQSSPSLRDRNLRNSSDSDDRSSDPNVDFDLKNLHMPPLSVFTVTGDVPFHVPNHAPAKVINASITAHEPFTYRLVSVIVKKADYSHITNRMDKDDPRVQEDPRLHNIFYGKCGNSKNISVYGGDPESPPIPDVESPSPPLPTPENRDPRVNRDPRTVDPRDPRQRDAALSPNIDPRSAAISASMLESRSIGELNAGPRVPDMNNSDQRIMDQSFLSLNNDPRLESRGDPRLSSIRSTDPRIGNRDPRAKTYEEDLLSNTDRRQRDCLLASMPSSHQYSMGIGPPQGQLMGMSGSVQPHNVNGIPGLHPPLGQSLVNLYSSGISGPRDMHHALSGPPQLNPYMPGYVPGHNNMLNMIPNMPPDSSGMMQGIHKRYIQMISPDALYVPSQHLQHDGMQRNKVVARGEWLPPAGNTDPRLKRSLEPEASFSPPPPLL